MAAPVSMRALSALGPPEFSRWLASLDAVVFDCDGVLWRGTGTISGASEAISRLRDAGKRVFFVTNNSTQSRRQYVGKLAKHGIEAQREDVLSSAFAAAEHLRAQALRCKSVYVVGEAGLVEELSDAGFHCMGADEEDGAFDPAQFDPSFVQSSPVGAVVIGMDRALSYLKLAKAAAYVRYSPGCHFIATNTDTTFPFGNGVLLPGAGTGVAALAAAVGRDPDVVVGKPSQALMRVLVSAHDLDRGRTLMVGDRLNTDIVFGRAGGLQTLLVMTGVTTEAEATASAAEERPEWVAPSVATLAALLRAGTAGEGCAEQSSAASVDRGGKPH